MSLLIDVLRRAEAGQARPASICPPPPTQPLRFELEPLAEPRPAQAQPIPPRPAQAHEATAQTRPPAAPPGASAAMPADARWRYVGLSGCVSALATAAWLWLASAPAASAPAHPAPTPAPAPTPTPAPVEPPQAPSPIIQPPEAPPARPRPAVASRPLGATAPRGKATPLKPPIHVDRAPAEAAPFSAALTAAHEAYGAGDLALARALYREVLVSAPDNPDVLDGLGAVALQQGQHELARQFFRRALVAHPLDPAALAGLARTERHDPMQAESRLKDSLTSQPDAIGTHLALGDALAAQQRWAEAQQAYFQAHSLAPGHPDIAYNLAVALDHLGQRRPAAGFYRKALQLADQHPARFSRHHCETRLHALQAQDPSP